MSPSKQGDGFVMAGADGPSGPRKIEFTTFLLGLASTALIHLGVAPHPETGQTQVELALARETLDLLDVLREKTRGNLTPEEELLFEKLLTDLRLQYVQAAKR